MITDIKADRLLVISDLHLGNPFSKAKQPTIDFLRWASENNYDIAINGDGFEIAQVSFTRIAKDVPEVFHAIKSYTNRGRNLYYIIGNHDIALENFLNDWGGFKMAPFLNVLSKQCRIRVEHGHLYDPAFVNNPDLYEFLTWLAGFFLQLNPKLYHLWIQFEKLKSKFFWNRKRASLGISGEDPAFYDAALELTDRGFDKVIFGHTHHSGRVQLPNGGEYFNSGSWLMGTPMVAIEDGQVQLVRWHPQGHLLTSKNTDRIAS